MRENENVTGARLDALPRDPNLVLAGSVRELSTYVEHEDQLVRPAVALWVDGTKGNVRNFALLSAPVDSEEAIWVAVQALIDALADSSPTAGDAAMPARVVVDLPALAAALEPLLSPRGVAVELQPVFPLLDDMFESMNAYVMEQEASFDWEIDLALLRPLFRAAAAYQELRPWEYLDDVPPIAVAIGAHGPRGNVKTLYGCVLGAAGEVFGIAFYYSRAGLRRTAESNALLNLGETDTQELRSQVRAELRRHGAPVDVIPAEIVDAAIDEMIAMDREPELEDSLAVYFDPADEADPAYLEWVQQHGLPLTREGEVPTFLRMTRQGEVRLPRKQEVTALTLALQAVTGFLQAHRDEIERLAAQPYPRRKVVTSNVRVADKQTIPVRWPGD